MPCLGQNATRISPPVVSAASEARRNLGVPTYDEPLGEAIP